MTYVSVLSAVLCVRMCSLRTKRVARAVLAGSDKL